MKIKRVLITLGIIALIGCARGNSKTSSDAKPDENSSSLTTSESSSLSERTSATNSTSSSVTSSSSLEPSSSSQATSSSSSSSSVSSSSSSSSAISSSSSSSSSSAASSTTSNPPDPIGVSTKTVSFLNGNFTNSSLNQPASQQQFVNWFNNGDDVLGSIGYSGYAQMNYIGNQNDSWRFSTLILGSGNSEGAITFNFNVHVTSVKIVVQPYTKYISYNNTYNIDRNATFLFDDEEYDLSVEESYVGETEKTTLTCIPDPEQNKFTIANKDAGQRVFVHSFELTYWN